MSDRAASMARIVALFDAEVGQFAEAATDRLIALDLPSYQGWPRDQILVRIMQPGYAQFGADLRAGTATQFPGYFQRVGMARAQASGVLEDVLTALQVAGGVMNDWFNSSGRR